jgi:hypothetical protein
MRPELSLRGNPERRALAIRPERIALLDDIDPCLTIERVFNRVDRSLSILSLLSISVTLWRLLPRGLVVVGCQMRYFSPVHKTEEL